MPSIFDNSHLPSVHSMFGRFVAVLAVTARGMHAAPSRSGALLIVDRYAPATQPPALSPSNVPNHPYLPGPSSGGHRYPQPETTMGPHSIPPRPGASLCIADRLATVLSVPNQTTPRRGGSSAESFREQVVDMVADLADPQLRTFEGCVDACEVDNLVYAMEDIVFTSDVEHLIDTARSAGATHGDYKAAVLAMTRQTESAVANNPC